MMADMDEPTATTASLEHNNNNSGNKQDNEDDPNGTGNGGGFVPPHEMAKELEEMVVNMVAKVDKVQDELTKKLDEVDGQIDQLEQAVKDPKSPNRAGSVSQQANQTD